MPCLPACLVDTTGLVLAGGRGSRMGGVDKGLQLFGSVPLALHALRRLQTQVSKVAVSANRNLAAYAGFGVPVWPDAAALEDFAGPLAGFLTGLMHCQSRYLLTVPCDAPLFPADLAARLMQALIQENADVAYASSVAADGTVSAQPAFCLMATAAAQKSLQIYTQQGSRSIQRWLAGQQAAAVQFSRPEGAAYAFNNANTLAELHKTALLEHFQAPNVPPGQ